MGSQEDDAKIVDHLTALSQDNLHRLKIQQKIEDSLDMAATSVPDNKILLKELQKIKIAFDGYNQYIDHHVEKAMSCIEKTPSTERIKIRRQSLTESLVRTHLPGKSESIPDKFVRASSYQIKKEFE